MSPTTCPRLPMSRWSTCGWYSTSCFPLLRSWSTLTWTLSGISSLLVLLVLKKNRDDEDREINHHGRPVEVGETENMQQANNVIRVFWIEIYIEGFFSHGNLFLHCVHRFLRKILCLWTRGFSRRHWKVFTAGDYEKFSTLPKLFSSNHWNCIDFIDP